MKIGIISDTHDHIENLKKARKLLKQKNIEVLLHCGDLCSPFMIRELEKFNIPIHLIFGNVADRYLISEFVIKSKNIFLHGDFGELVLDEKKIFLTHYPELANAFSRTGNYDLICHGHTHEKRNEIINNTLIINPGELMGRLKNPSVAVYNTKTSNVYFYRL